MKISMPQMARTGKNGHGDPRPKVVCIGCKNTLAQKYFSYKVKSDPSQGIRENCKACSAERARKEREKRKNNWKYKPTKHMLYNSRQRAKAAGLEHTLLLDDIVIPDYCPVLGIKLETGDRKEKDNSPSIDRIDNTKGYIRSNIIVVSNRANILKKDATLDELIMIGKFYGELKGKQN
jgi:hypothetical protein